jgi:hypothetical protein
MINPALSVVRALYSLQNAAIFTVLTQFLQVVLV